jgi:Arc/MetJ-type ribon-helix-helix transcriptional regulator
MQVDISKELEGIVTARVAHGMNLSAGDVVREALYCLVERDRLWNERREVLDRGIEQAMDEMARGEGISEADLLKHIAARSPTRQ